MSEHYVTAMTETARGYMLLACRCGDIVPAPPHEADEEFKTHLTTAIVLDRAKTAEITVQDGSFPVVHYAVEVAFPDDVKALYGVFEYEDTAQEFARAYRDHVSVSGAEVVPVNRVSN